MTASNQTWTAGKLGALEHVIAPLGNWVSSLHPTPGRDLLEGILANMPALIAELRAARKVVEAAREFSGVAYHYPDRKQAPLRTALAELDALNRE